MARALATAHEADVAEALNRVDPAAAAQVLSAFAFEFAGRVLEHPEFAPLPVAKGRKTSWRRCAGWWAGTPAAGPLSRVFPRSSEAAAIRSVVTHMAADATPRE